MQIQEFKFHQILEVNKRLDLSSDKNDLYFCLWRHLISSSLEKELNGFTFKDIKNLLNNEKNDDNNIELMLTHLVTEGYLEFKSKKWFIKQ